MTLLTERLNIFRSTHFIYIFERDIYIYKSINLLSAYLGIYIDFLPNRVYIINC